MTSALRAGVIDIGFPSAVGATRCGLAGMSSSAVAAKCAELEHRARARYRKRLPGSRRKVVSFARIRRISSRTFPIGRRQRPTRLRSGLTCQIEDAAGAQFAVSGFGERDQLALRRDRADALQGRRVATPRQGGLAPRPPPRPRPAPPPPPPP